MGTLEIVLIIVGSVFLVFCILLFGTIILSKKIFNFRSDFSNVVNHTLPSDYPDIISTKITTKNEDSKSLNGYFYKHKDNDNPKGLIIFFHGIGGGQSMYRSQLMYFVRNGYYMIAFDNEGSCLSEGRTQPFIAQVNNDSKAILNFVNAFEEFKNLPIYTLGHSLGGYASVCCTLHNILPIKKSVSISGFHDIVSVSMAKMPKAAFYLRPFVYLASLIGCGKVTNFTMTKAIKKHPEISYLHLQGTLDNIVPNRISSDILKNRCSECSNLTIKMFDGWKHLPYLKKESETYRDGLVYKKFNLSNGLVLEDEDLNIDEAKFVESNEELLKNILDFFDKN